MLNKNDKKYFDVEAIMIYDPSTSTEAVQTQSMNPSSDYLHRLTAL